MCEISIHALREEGDREALNQMLEKQYISIHALREEGDPEKVWEGKPNEYFYPRPPRGGRPVLHKVERVVGLISIHALREEGDCRPGSLS